MAASINIEITGGMIIFVCLELDNIHCLLCAANEFIAVACEIEQAENLISVTI